MSTVIENIDSLFSVKSDIRQAIEDKGVDMSNTPFTSFAVKISEIPSGGGGDTDIEDALIMKNIGLYTSSIYNNPRVTKVGSYAFAGMTYLYSVNFPNVTTINIAAFSNAGIVSYSFPKATEINNYAFYSCNGITSINFPLVSHVGSYAFARCPKLSEASLPSCTTMDGYVFQSCSSLTRVDLPMLRNVASYGFQSLSMLETVNIPSVSIVYTYAFESCKSLKEISLPECKSIYNYAFPYCSSLSVLTAPKLEMTMVSTFAYCDFSTLYLPMLSQLGSSCFYGCKKLESIYVGTERSSVCYMGNSAVFNNTPMKDSSYLGYYGSIYVPMSLVDQYKTKTNWTYYADRIVGV